MHSFREVKCLQGYSKTLRMGNVRISPLVVEYNVVVISARLNPMGNQFSIPLLWNLCSESVGHKILRPVEDSDTGGPSSIFVRWNTCLLFNTDVVNFVWKNDEGEEGSIVLLIFVFWRCLNRRWVRVGGVGQKVVFRAAEIATFSSGDFNRSNKHDAYWRVITAGYLYWCFRSLYLGNL